MAAREIGALDPGLPWSRGHSFAPALRVGGLIYVSGQLALDAEGNLVGEGSVEAQARCIFGNIDTILRVGGASLSDVVRLTCYCIGFDDYGDYAKVRGELFAARYPASTTVGISELLVPGALLEVDAIAMAPDSQPTG